MMTKKCLSVGMEPAVESFSPMVAVKIRGRDKPDPKEIPVHKVPQVRPDLKVRLEAMAHKAQQDPQDPPEVMEVLEPPAQQVHEEQPDQPEAVEAVITIR
jgi:hypothetical protein